MVSAAEQISAGLDNAAIGHSPDILTHIYQEQINLCVLERSPDQEVSGYCQQLIATKPAFNLRCVIPQDSITASLQNLLPELPGQQAMVEDLGLLLDMYSCLFELEETGLRLQVLDRAMCPRFHTDKLGCRMVTTYQGTGTEWLFNRDVDRSKLGAGSNGLSDNKSGLYSNAANIQQVSASDIVLLKGDGWYGNEGMGAVHRSPAVTSGEKRIVVTLDFA